MNPLVERIEKAIAWVEEIEKGTITKSGKKREPGQTDIFQLVATFTPMATDIASLVEARGLARALPKPHKSEHPRFKNWPPLNLPTVAHSDEHFRYDLDWWCDQWLRGMRRLRQLVLDLEPQGRASRKGRRKKDEKSLTDATLGALCKWHGYDNGSVTNYEPARNRGLAEMANKSLRPGQKPLSENALTRLLKEKGMTHKDYERRCAQGTIGASLMYWRGDTPSQVLALRDEEYGRGRDD